jgi:hypothetical protein
MSNWETSPAENLVDLTAVFFSDQKLFSVKDAKLWLQRLHTGLIQCLIQCQFIVKQFEEISLYKLNAEK